ncbi:hypothetical protein niasHS_009722 [Heterodera schachtii]|uniref:Uncharacterized protein n=1 Tax=Heterodera schachtii TaxID=97005 RepID=A0ABD2IWD9_HETSC
MNLETKKNAVEVEEVFVAKQNAQKVFENMTTETQSPAEKLLAAMQISVPIFFPSAFMKNTLEESNLKEGDRTGNHEAGHAGACKLNPHCTRITYMTTIPDPRTNSRGRTDYKTSPNYNKKQLESFVEMFLGGPISEGVLTGPIDFAGLQND